MDMWLNLRAFDVQSVILYNKEPFSPSSVKGLEHEIGFIFSTKCHMHSGKEKMEVLVRHNLIDSI